MEFINTGLDERILKSLDVEHPSEELVKAMNKQGLVQKEVTVQGKNGTFTRKQWVKASEGESPKSKKPSLSDIQGYGYDSSTATGDPTYLKIGDKGYYKIGNNKWQYNPSQGHALGGTYTDSQISDIVSKTSEEVKVIPSAKKNSKFEQSTQSNEAISNDKSKKGEPFERYTLWWVNNGSHYEDFNTLDELKQGLKQKGLPASLANLDINKLDKKQGYVKTDYQNYSVLAYPHSKPAQQDKGKKSNSQIPDKLKKKLLHYGDPSVPCKSEYNGYDITVFYSGKIKISKGDTEVLSTYSDLQAAEYLMKNKTESSDELIDKMREVTGTKDLTSIAKKHGLTWEHSDNKVINSARAELKLVNAVKSGKITLEDLKSDKDSVSSKLSPADAKKKTQEVTKGVSDKKSFMEKAKAQGITWKENDHEGINWMRCCMAMNKHFENGGIFSEK